MGRRKFSQRPKGTASTSKGLKEILRLRKQDKDERNEQETLLDVYLKAMENAAASRARAA